MDREDLGALAGRLTRVLIEAERPLLAANGLSMWAYIALTQLAREPASTQLALAEAINYDKTRLIALLDGLEHDGLVTRTPDPTDRRARIVALTRTGERVHAAAQADIHAMEDQLLGELGTADGDRLRLMLSRAIDCLARSDIES